MRKSLAVLAIIICSHVQAQEYSSGSKLKVGGGYTKDFPGLSGYGLFGEYAYSLSEYLEGGVGIKRLSMSGYPRTSTVNEYTKATTLDFNIFFLPFAGETSVLRIGAGYSFHFMKRVGHTRYLKRMVKKRLRLGPSRMEKEEHPESQFQENMNIYFLPTYRWE